MFRHGLFVTFRRNAHSGLMRTIKTLMENPPTQNSMVRVHGHIKSVRQSKNVGFIDLSDGSDYRTLNVVVQDPQSMLSSTHLKVGQSIAVEGEWVESKGTQDYELVLSPINPNHNLQIIGQVPDTYPIQKKVNTMQHLRNFPTLRHRTSTLASILRFRSFLEGEFIRFFNDNQCVKVTPPIITGSDCEGAGEQFKVDRITKDDPAFKFFGKDTYLTVSTQLHLEILAMSLNRVWTLTPCFRAEDSNTNRHLSEFWMLEAELCYVDDVKQLTTFTENMIRYVTQSLKHNSADILGSRYKRDDIAVMTNRWDTILSEKEWPSITYTEAIDIINRVMLKGRSKGRLQWGDSIQTPHEKWLAGTHFQSPVFITDYPADVKPFYMPKSKEFNPEKPTVACYDLILPDIGELVGGSLREHKYDSLVEEMKARNMNVNDMEWYLSLRENGTVPHGGFGMGFERLVAYLACMDNIKDVIPFPRVPDDCKC